MDADDSDAAGCRSGEGEPQDSESPDLSSPEDYPVRHTLLTRELEGRYREIREYARGGVGRVLLVYDRDLQREVGLKELAPEASGTAPTLSPDELNGAPDVRTARFLREARIASRLEHPSIVPVYEAGHRLDGTPYYCMRLIRGWTLKRALQNAATLRERLELLPHFVALCQAMAYAHSRGVVHRDIKPSNVVIGEFGQTVVIDWGLAKQRGDPELIGEEDLIAAQAGGHDSGSGLTQVGSFLGTPAYAPPEQVRGDLEQVDERSDVYSLGVVLYEILTGTPPYRGASSGELFERILSGDCVPVKSVEPGAPNELAAICERAMQHSPESRYPSAEGLARDMARFQAGALVGAYEYGLADFFRRFVSKHRGTVTVAGLALAVLAVTGGISLQQILQARNREHAQRLAAEKMNRELLWENYAATLGVAQERLHNEAYTKAGNLLYTCPKEHRHWEWGYLLKRSSPALVSLRPGEVPGMPPGPLRRAVLSPESRYLIDDRWETGVKSLFDLQTGETVTVTPGYAGWAECTQLLKGGRELVVSVDARTVHVVERQSGAVLRQFACETGILRSFLVGPRGRLAAGYFTGTGVEWPREVIVWDFQTGRERARFERQPCKQAFHAAMLNPRPLRSTGWEGPLGSILGFLNGEDKLVCADEELALLDIETQTQSQSYCACLSRHAAYAAGGAIGAVLEASNPYPMTLRDIRSGIRVADLAGAFDANTLVAISDDGSKVATAQGNKWQLWSVGTGELIEEYSGHTGAICSISFSPNGQCVVTTDPTNTKIWSVAGPGAIRNVQLTLSSGAPAELAWHEQRRERIRAASYDLAARRLATGMSDGAVVVWNVPAFSVCRAWQAHLRAVPLVRLSPDGSTVLTLSDTGVAKVWDAGNGQLRFRAGNARNECVTAAAFGPRGDCVVLGLNRATPDTSPVYEVRFLNPQNGRQIRAACPLPHPVAAAAFSPDARWLLVATRVLDPNETRVLALDPAPEGEFLEEIATVDSLGSMVFQQGGEFVLLVSENEGTRLCRLGERRPEWTRDDLRGVHAVFHPDGARFAFLDASGKLSIHGTKDGRELIALGTVQGPVAFSADGRELVALRDETAGIVFHTADWTIGDKRVAFDLALAHTRRHLGIGP